MKREQDPEFDKDWQDWGEEPIFDLPTKERMLRNEREYNDQDKLFLKCR